MELDLSAKPEDRGVATKRVIFYQNVNYEFSDELIDKYIEYYNSYCTRNLAEMIISYLKIKGNIEQSLKLICELNSENSEWSTDIHFFRKVLHNLSDIGEAIYYKKSKAFARKNYRENLKLIVSNKNWLKILKHIKEDLRLEVHDVSQEIEFNRNNSVTGIDWSKNNNGGDLELSKSTSDYSRDKIKEIINKGIELILKDRS